MAEAKQSKKDAIRKQPTKRERATRTKKPKETVQGPSKSKSISVRVFGTDGKPKGTVSVSKRLFGFHAPEQLLAQAVRVHLANQRHGTASTKTRGEVEGSTRKIYRQKGTGRARHGAIRAPIFVGGGIVFGPKPRDYHLTIPTRMKRRALAGALTAKLKSGDILIIDGLDKLEAKTRRMVQVLESLGVGKSTLLVVSPHADTVVRAARNIPSIDILSAHSINTYEVLAHAKVLVMKSALSDIEATFAKS